MLTFVLLAMAAFAVDPVPPEDGTIGSCSKTEDITDFAKQMPYCNSNGFWISSGRACISTYPSLSEIDLSLKVARPFRIPEGQASLAQEGSAFFAKLLAPSLALRCTKVLDSACERVMVVADCVSRVKKVDDNEMTLQVIISAQRLPGLALFIGMQLRCEENLGFCWCLRLPRIISFLQVLLWLHGRRRRR